MPRRDLTLTPRLEEVRETRRIVAPIHYSPDEIHSHFNDCLCELRNQFETAEQLNENKRSDECKMIWRSQIVFAEGFLDFFIHEISKFCLFQMFVGNWPKTDKYNNMAVPMNKVEEAISKTSTDDWFFLFLNEKFSKEVYLSAESMNDQLNMIGVSFNRVMSVAFGEPSEENARKIGRKIVKELFDRRNIIAHQNDRDHLSLEQNDIDRKFVEDYIDKVDKIVRAIITIVKEINSEMSRD